MVLKRVHFDVRSLTPDFLRPDSGWDNGEYAIGETQSQSTMRQEILVSNRSNRDERLYPGTPEAERYQSFAVGSL